MSKVAWPVEPLDGWRGDVVVYELEPPLDGHQFVIVSAVSASALGSETYLFGAERIDGKWEVTDWGELHGSTNGTLCHATALGNAGYQIASHHGEW